MLAIALERIDAISRPGKRPAAEYLHGLRIAVSAAFDYGIESLERNEAQSLPLPTALLSQARLAARHGIRLETVMRRYLAGNTLLGDFLIEAAEHEPDADSAAMKLIMQRQAALLDHLITAVSDEYARELALQNSASRRRLLKQVDLLLEGHSLAADEIPYDFDGAHLALVARGDRLPQALREILPAPGRRALLVPRGPEEAWAWLGGRASTDMADVATAIAADAAPGLTVAFGEPAAGLGGWRLTLEQAQAAITLATHLDQSCVKYVDIALLAMALADDLLATSLQHMYLEPVECRPGGTHLFKTLGAYYAAQGNVTSAAAAVGINRKTVLSHLRTAEAAIGRSLVVHAAELETALKLRDYRLAVTNESYGQVA
jgi:hypothetical protein